MEQGTLSLRHIIDQVSQEKGIDPQILVEATEQAILTAAKRTFGPTRELEARFNQETGSVDLFQFMIVVETETDPEREISLKDARLYSQEGHPTPELGDELGIQIFYLPEDAEKARQQDRDFGDLLHMQQHRRGFGRIAAQTAKQVIIQRVRDAERERIYEEFKDRKGEVVTGVVRRFERGSNIIVDLGKGIEAVLPSREQTPRESYRPGDRIVAFLKDIDRDARGQQLILSRGDVGLLVKLFEMEVPEIYEGIVRIVAASREPGARSKIAVSSRDNDVDPVGACVGMKGSRVQAVVQELRGEKIDIVPWDRDPARFVCNAIAPAEVSRVVIDEVNGGMELVVPDVKLSLAIGRRGQNVRLASRLTGWRLEIISESRFRQIEEDAMASLARIASLSDAQVKMLYRLGFRTLDEVVEASVDELASIEGIAVEQVEVVRTDAGVALEQERLERLEAAKQKSEMPGDKERMLLVPGMTVRLLQALEQAGYGRLENIVREKDSDKLALKTGIELARARSLHTAVADFLASDWPIIEGAIRARRRSGERELAAIVTRPAQGEGEADVAASAASAAAEKAALSASAPQGE
ncbi:MAG: transcription termination factor NusA [Polyangiales bacterium]